jgi:hypothetical protein
MDVHTEALDGSTVIYCLRKIRTINAFFAPLFQPHAAAGAQWLDAPVRGGA